MLLHSVIRECQPTHLVSAFELNESHPILYWYFWLEHYWLQRELRMTNFSGDVQIKCQHSLMSTASPSSISVKRLQFSCYGGLLSKIQSYLEKKHQHGLLREEALLFRQNFVPGDCVSNKFCLRESGHKEQKGIWAIRWWEKGSKGRRGLEWGSTETVLNIWNLQLYFSPFPSQSFIFFSRD